MAYAPIALTMPQYEDYANWYLKAYTQGTTTPLSMATDSGGGTTLAKSEIDANGFPTTDGSARFIPYINGAYDLWMFPTSAEADANDTTNAIQLADNINADPASAITVTTVSYAANVSALLAIDGTVESRVNTSGYHIAGDGGGGEFYWDATQDKANHNGGTIIDPDVPFPSDFTNQTQVAAWFNAGTGTGCWVRLYNDVLKPEYFGVIGDGVRNELVQLQAFFSIQPSGHYELTKGHVYNLGTVATSDPITSNVKHFYIKSREHFKIIGNNATFKSESLHIATPQNFVFYLEDTNNIDIDNVNGYGVSFDRDPGYSGMDLFVIHNQSRSTSGVRIVSKGKTLGRLVLATSANPALYRTRNVKLHVELDSGYYNVNLVNNCDDLEATIISNDVVRSYFPYGVENHVVRVISRNHYKFADILIKTYEYDTRNISLKYELDTSNSAGAICAIEHQSDTQDKSLENITIDVNIKNHTSGPQFSFYQYTTAGASQPTTNSTFANIRLKGVIQTQPLTSDNFVIGVSPNKAALLFIEPSLNPLFEDTKGFTVILGNKIVASKRGDLNGDTLIPVPFLVGSGWGGRLNLWAIENQATLTTKSTSRIYNLLGATSNPQPAAIVNSDLVSNVENGGPLAMTIALDTSNTPDGLPAIGVNITGHPAGVTGLLLLELEITGQRFLTGWY